ncbi:type II toxin-antitoxin system RelE/ParE family toxin [Magnetococcales bacterium HHB-1]
MSTLKKKSVVFFCSDSGAEPVRDWLRSLPQSDKKAIGQALQLLEYRWPLGLPMVRKMAPGLWELRVTLAQRIVRVFFSVAQDHLVLLHGFIKKSQKTPQTDLQVVRRRQKQLGDGG